MPCYILRAGDTEMVKIGWAEQNVEARRIFLQTAHWLDLTLIRVLDGDRWVENAMHKAFAKNRVRREWFVFHPDMLTHVPEGPAPCPKPTELVSWAADYCRHPWPRNCNCNRNWNGLTEAEVDRLLKRTKPGVARESCAA